MNEKARKTEELMEQMEHERFVRVFNIFENEAVVYEKSILCCLYQIKQHVVLCCNVSLFAFIISIII